MKSIEWKTYRTRFLIKATQLTSPLTFTDPLGRTHSGRKGDYLVESSEGVLSITPCQIFEDIYVTMPDPDIPLVPQPAEPTFNQNSCDVAMADRFRDFDLEDVPEAPPQIPRNRPSEADRVRRKLPQPYRDRRTPSRLGMMQS